MFVIPASGGGGTDATSAETLELTNYSDKSTRKVYFDLDEFVGQYGKISTGGDQYWTFTLDSTMYVLVRGVGGTGSNLTGEIAGHEDAYLRAGPIRTSVTGGTSGDVFTIAARVDAGTHTLKVSSSADAGYSLVALVDDDAQQAEFDSVCTYSVPESVSDKMFKCQWNLSRGTSGDMRVQEAWDDGYTGDGIHIAVVDEGIDYLHPDLNPNILAEQNLNIALRTTDPLEPIYSHGNAVAGIIAAAANDVGIRGVAHDASLYGFNYLAYPAYVYEQTAMTNHVTTRGVSNHSYGFPDTGQIWRSHDTWNASLTEMLKTGFGGKGTVYVNAAGNAGAPGERGATEDTDLTHFDEYNSHIGAVPVCAVGENGRYLPAYSELGGICGFAVRLMASSPRASSAGGEMTSGRPHQPPLTSLVL